MTCFLEFTIAFVFRKSSYCYCEVFLYYTVSFESIHISWINFLKYKSYKISNLLLGMIGFLLFQESVVLSDCSSTFCVFVFRQDDKFEWHPFEQVLHSIFLVWYVRLFWCQVQTSLWSSLSNVNVVSCLIQAGLKKSSFISTSFLIWKRNFLMRVWAHISYF